MAPRRPESPGFTLVELLLSILISLILGGAVVSLFVLFSGHFEQTSEIVSARQRGDLVLATLEGPVLQSGLGLPAAADFGDAFKPPGASAPGPRDIKGWAAPQAIVDNGAALDGRLRLVYAVPARSILSPDRAVAAGEVPFSPGVDATVRLEAPVAPTMLSTSPLLAKAWVLFPATGVPLRVMAYDESIPQLTLRAQRDWGLISRYDELHYLRGLDAYADKGRFMVEDVASGSGSQPQVENIAALHFDLDPSGRVLTATVVAAGEGTSRQPLYGDEGDLDGWPSGSSGVAIAIPDFATKWRYRRLVVVQQSWRVRN